MKPEDYSLANVISTNLYNAGSSVVSNVWWFTKETTKQTIKIAIPTLITLAIAKNTGMLDLNVTIKNRMQHNFIPVKLD